MESQFVSLPPQMWIIHKIRNRRIFQEFFSFRECVIGMTYTPISQLFINSNGFLLPIKKLQFFLHSIFLIELKKVHPLTKPVKKVVFFSVIFLIYFLKFLFFVSSRLELGTSIGRKCSAEAYFRLNQN